MHYSPASTFPDAAQEASNWVRELSELLGCEPRVAYEILRTFLHLLRDRLPIDDNAKVANDLPLVLRGLYYEAWDPPRARAQGDLTALPSALRSALPQAISSDPEVFAKLQKLFEGRRHHKRTTKLDVALRLCAISASSGPLGVNSP